MAYFIFLACALLCYLVAALNPATDIATVFSVVSAGFVILILLEDFFVLASTFLFLRDVRLEGNDVHYNLIMSGNYQLAAAVNIVVNVATSCAGVWMLLKLWDMV